MRTVFLLAVISFAGVSSLACTHVKVEDARGPGGGEWKAISCSHMNAKCFERAEHMCPNGYVFARAAEGSPKTVAAQASDAAKVTTLPPRDQWGGDMYSKQPGKILVQCASSPPKLTASRD
jgi:hypothetical protein